MSVEALRSRLGSALSSRDLAEIEAGWKEYVGLHPTEYPHLLHVAEQMARFDKSGLVGELCLGLAKTLSDRGDHAGAFRVAQLAIRIGPRAPGLREFLLTVYQALYAGRPHIEDFLAKSGLAEEGNLRQQVETLDKYLAFEEGAHVFHQGGWGYGEVVEFDPVQEQMVVDFQKKKQHKIGLLSATKILQRLAPDHFGVFQHYRPDELKEIIATDPARVFRIYLASYGRQAPLKNIREALAPAVLTKAEWSRFWGKAKKAILKDPRLKVGKGASPVVELREKAMSVEEEVAEKMEARETGIEKCAVAREYLRTLDLTPPLAAAIGGLVDRAIAKGPGSPSTKLALLYLKADLGGEGAPAARKEAAALAAAQSDLAALLLPLETGDRKSVLHDLMAEGGDEWPARIDSLLRGGDAEIASLAFDHLAKARPEMATAFLTRLTASPREAPDQFLWFARAFLSGALAPELIPGETRDTVMDKLLTVANQLGLDAKRAGDPALKEFLRQVRNFLTSRRGKFFAEYVGQVNLEYARFLHAKVYRNRGLTDQTKQILLEEIEGEHPKVRTAPGKEDAGPEAADEVVYTSRRGYHKREAELRNLMEVEIPANAEDLGRAARFGDISENAEYSAALEKQAFLMRRLKELRTDLERARIIEPGEVTAERVVLGTRVRLSNKSRGIEERFTILGPWDVDLEHGVISYLSPVGKGLLGNEAGSHVEITLPDGKVNYEILGVEKDPEFTRASEG